MHDKKEKLIGLIMEHNVSAIVILSEKLELDQDAVIELINELVSENGLHGIISEDGVRFYRSDAKVSDAPVIHRDDKLPEFLSYDTRPGKVIAIIGFIVLIGAGLVNYYATDVPERDFAALIFLVGLVIFLGGLYLATKKQMPD
ncbi:MAG: hypothetical protein KAU48_02100 [Candidatus Thorarchaeota archaeon]|nr:hypothetical protein [Candidatus Thorarchaeota archaeon]